MIMASNSPGTRNCVSCGRAIAWDANVCPYCGHDFRIESTAQQITRQANKFHGSLLILILLIILCWPAAIIYFFYKRD
jgi:predicted nucleic acid-binding Zn ribbon protein